MTDRKTYVAVIGAGVAGLTAAHELAKRGYKVFVYDVEPDPRDPRTPLVGGLAATQWYRAPRLPDGVERPEMRLLEPVIGSNLADPTDWPDNLDEPETKNTQDALLSKFEGRWPLLPFAPNSAELSTVVLGRIERIAEVLAAWLDSAAEFENIKVGGTTARDEVTVALDDPFADAERALLRACAVTGALAAALRKVAVKFSLKILNETTVDAGLKSFEVWRVGGTQLAKVTAISLGVLHAQDASRYLESQRYVEIRIEDLLLPGEHGYRFFPAFYHHVFDTMRRIPLLERTSEDAFSVAARSALRRENPDVDTPRTRWIPGPRTVFDNLQNVRVHAFDSASDAPVRPLERFKTNSLRGLLELLDMFQAHADVPMVDIIRGQLKMLRYMTSCKARRRTYEGQSWTTFAEASHGGAEYQRLLDHWPQALVGLQASIADARTTGTVLTQLILDQLRPDGYRDGTLNAPTSEAWLDPWKRYLADELEVEFRCEAITRIVLDPRGDAVDLGDEHEESLFEYVVVATSVEATARLGSRLELSLAAQPDLHAEFLNSPFAAARHIVGTTDEYKRKPGGGRAFRHFAGIQYFLASDFAPLRGHVYYPNSAWRLSSVSQAQFRRDQPDPTDRYQGLISVVIAAWDVPGGDAADKKPAWECSEAQIAKEVWAQITASVERSGKPRPPQPIFFAIDRNIEFAGSGKARHVEQNRAPFLVNAYELSDVWPGEPGNYRVHMRRFVFAGTYMRTFTRLVTMEAANESARHAVNALLRQDRGSAGFQECEIFDPEDRELEELELFKRIDAGLFARNLPHFMDILEVEDQAIALLERSGGRPATVIAAALELARSAGGIGSEIARLLRDVLRGA